VSQYVHLAPLYQIIRKYKTSWKRNIRY